MNSLYVFLAQIGLNGFILLLSIILWKILWVENYPQNVPKGHYKHKSIKSYTDRKEFFKAESFSDIFVLMWIVLHDFSSSYWIQNVGFDGYCYLFIQRQCLFFLCLLIGIGLVILGIALVIPYLSLSPYIYYYISQIYTPYRHSIFVFTVTSLFINRVIYMRKHLQSEYIARLFSKNRIRGLDWMQLRTIHVEGLLFDDLNGDLLRQKIDNALEDNGIFKRVDQLLIIPAYYRLLKLELKLRELEYGQQVLQGDDPFLKRLFLKMCIPKKFKDQLKFDNKKLSIEKKIDQEVLKKYEGSGHAIICFDSIEAARFCLDKYSPNKTFLQIGWESIKDLFSKCCGNNQERIRSRKSSVDSETAANTKEFSIMCQEVPDPNDIAWLNLKGETRGWFIWRRILINLIFIFMLIFFSTPAAIFTFIQNQFQIDFFSFGWTDYIPKPFGPLLKIYLPALVIVLLNQIIIYFIELVTSQEMFNRHSVLQVSVFRKYYLYLMFNMIIVPSFLMATQDSIYEIIIGMAQNDFSKSFSRLYTEDHGMVFATIITQSAAISAFVYLNRIAELFDNYFSTFLTYHQRNYKNDEQTYLKDTDNIFQYGYFYAQGFVMLSIVFQFMLSSWWIIFSGVFFFFVRHCMDGYLLLTVHTCEMESTGNMAKTVLQYVMIGMLLFQGQFLAGFLIKSDWFQASIAGVLLFFTLVIWYILRKPFFDISLMEDKTIDFSRYNRNVMKSEWRQFYKHPLIISTNGSYSFEKTGFKLASQNSNGNSKNYIKTSEMNSNSSRPRPQQHHHHHHHHSETNKNISNTQNNVNSQSSNSNLIKKPTQNSNYNINRLSINNLNQKKDDVVLGESQNKQISSNPNRNTLPQSSSSSNNQPQKNIGSSYKSKFSQIRTSGFATDTDNGAVYTREDSNQISQQSQQKNYKRKA